MANDRLSIVLMALAAPTRRAILSRLEQGEATVLELAAPFDLKLPTVSKHLKVLQRAGLISQGRKAQWRPCRLEPAPLREVAQWAENFRAHFERQYQRIDDYLTQLDANSDNQQGDNHEHDRTPLRTRKERSPAPGKRRGKNPRSGKD